MRALHIGGFAMHRFAAPAAGNAGAAPAAEGVQQSLAGGIDATRGFLRSLVAAAPALPAELAAAWRVLMAQLEDQGLLWTVLSLAVFVGLGFGAEKLYWYLSARFRRRLIGTQLDTLHGRLQAVWLRSVYGLGLVFVFALGSIGAFLLFDWPPLLQEIVLSYLLLVLIVGIFVLSGFFDIKSLDYGPLLSTLLGFYLLLCALTAIGLYMSSLTTYPVVSAVAGFTIFFILMNIGRLWQEYDFLRDFTWFLSIAGRTEKMLLGLITTKDVIYYLIIVYLFISFTLLKLQDGRKTRHWSMRAGRYLAVIFSGLLIGYISSRPRFTGYWDTTARQVNTIRPRSHRRRPTRRRDPRRR